MMRHGTRQRWAHRFAYGLGAWAGAAGLALAGPAGAEVVVDGFDTQQVLQIPSAGGGGGPASSSNVVAAPEAIGGERDGIASRSMGNGFVDLLVNPSGTDSSLSFALGSSPGEATIVWDGPDGNAESLDSDGLGGIDFTEGGANTGLRFRARSDLGADVVVTVTGASGGVSDALLELPAGVAYEWRFLPFSAFASPELFTDVGSLSLTIPGEPGLDVQITRIAAPEASGAGVALCALAALGLYRSRRTLVPLG